ncbi:MAG: aminotransferase class I/II-fold pyridoxal phosphate-dependent enzyme, partial [Candidatus Zixiibacteriota bacterium]
MFMNRELEQVVFSGIVAIRDRLLRMPNPLRLESGEPSFDTPPHIKEAMTRALQDNHTHYAPSTGILPLREAIFKKVSEKNGIGYLTGPEQVVVTNGGMHALYTSLRTILNPGDEVIIPCPVWTATSWMIKLAGGQIRPVRLKPELNYRWDIEELSAAVTPACKAILLNTPHNPTGGVLTAGDLEGILDIAEKHGLYVIADEAYEDIIYDKTHVSIAS